ncbi:MAG: hypothetical protein K6F84_05265 [Lachnospiraceae bacterium]|nr:hypothetical protein [Lachnospiraceae bacterium]
MDFLEIIKELSVYRNIIIALFEITLLAVLSICVSALVKNWKKLKEDEEKSTDIYRIKADFHGEVDKTTRQNVIREIFSPDGVNPVPNSYMCISDGGKEVYVRSVTLSKLPKRVRFASTLHELFAFPNCTATVFVDPIDNETISRKIDRQINILESEQIGEAGNTNRVRKLGSQISKTTKWAYEVESGEKKFFYAGFLFTFVAESIDELNNITDDFRSLALNKKMDISNCYGVQSEAFLANLPLNRKGGTIFGKINSDCVKMHLLDQDALSVVLNYTSDHFSHKHGIPLGHNLYNGQPFIFDLFDGSHDGFTFVICGKTGSGKSASIKMMIERYVPLGYRFVIIDSQTRKGTSEGEYASLAEVNGGVNYQISSKNTNILNIFDVQESIEFVKDGPYSGHEVKTLNLNSAVTEIVYNLRTIIRGNMQTQTGAESNMDTIMDSDISEVLTRITKSLFAERGIVHGDAGSLYVEDMVVKDGALQSGVAPKELPTITDFFKKLIIEQQNNTDAELDKMYRFVVNNLRENVRELYYTESGVFFERADYEALPDNPQRVGEKVYNGERVIAIKGIRPYYDGQSTFAISRNCPVTNIDISQLTMVERCAARDIALHIIDGGFVQKNSESLEKSDKLVVVVDEAHESFEDISARQLLSNEVRTGRKRNVSLIFSTQTVEEWLRHPETSDILSQAAVKMIFKQDVKDRQVFMDALKITDRQVDIIANQLGVVTDKTDSEAKNRHRGEACIIDGEQVQFIKIDYLRSVEKYSIETDTSQVITATRPGA